MGKSDKRPGGVFDLIFWLVAIGFAGYRAVNAPTTTGRVVWGALVCFGLVMLALSAFARVVAKPAVEAGAEIDDLQRKLYSGPHQRRQVDDGEIRRQRLDAAFYRDETANLERLGFRHVADYVDETAAAAMPSARAVLRAFLSRDGRTMAAVYDVRFRGPIRLFQLVGLMPRDLRCVEFEAELSDGSFVCTGNAFEASKASDFPDVARRFLPARTPTADVWPAHEQHVAEVLRERPGATPIAMRDLRDLWASQDRLEALKSAHRNSSEYDAVSEFERVAGRPLNEDERAVADAAARRHADRMGAERDREDARDAEDSHR